MFAELLKKVNETDFEDLFQPHSPEEVEKRWPVWKVIFAAPKSERRGPIKSVEVHSPENREDLAINKVLINLSIYSKELEKNTDKIKGYMYYRYAIRIKKSDKIVDNEGLPMNGLFAVKAVEQWEAN